MRNYKGSETRLNKILGKLEIGESFSFNSVNLTIPCINRLKELVKEGVVELDYPADMYTPDCNREIRDGYRLPLWGDAIKVDEICE